MAKKNRPSVIIRRQETGDHDAHHGGAWKIAYADFMTAMMAFFLVMWLLNATTDEQRRGIAQYFNPLADEKSATPPGKLLNQPTSPMTVGSSFDRLQEDEHFDTTGPVPIPYNGHGASSPIDTIPATRHESARQTETGPAVIVPIGGPRSGSVDKPGFVGAEEARTEQAELKQMTDSLRKAIESGSETAGHSDNIGMHFGRDEIRIELHDTTNEPMFDLGASAPNKAGRAMLSEIARWLAAMPERISIVGYTDAAPFRGKAGGAMSNWTLSALRADQSREIMVKAGYPDTNIISVAGGADRELADKTAPSAAANRRVVIIMHRLHPFADTPDLLSPTERTQAQKPVENSMKAQ